MHLTASFDWLLFGIAVVAMPIVSWWTGRAVAKAPDSPLVGRYWRIVLRGWAIVALIMLDWLLARRTWSALGLDWPIGSLGLGGLLGVCGLAAIAAVQILRLRSTLTEERAATLRQQMREVKILPRSAVEFRVFLVVAITAGVWEELLYRGFLVWFAARWLGLYGAAALSVAVFGIGHAYQGWRRVAVPTVLGAVFTAGYIATQSLWWVMALHALVDVFGGIVAYRVVQAARFTERDSAAA